MPRSSRIVVIYATDQVTPATSEYQAQMRIWLAARATGIVTLLLLTFQICVGLVLSHPTNKSTWKLSKRIFPWHEHLWVFLMAFLAVHIVSLILDPFAGVGIAGSFIPGLSSYRSSPVALGTLALYAFLITAITARYTRLLPPGAWLSIHRLSLIVFGLAWLHGILAGTDSEALRLHVCRDRPGRRLRRRLPLLGVPQGSPDIRYGSHGGSRPMNVSNVPIRRTLTVAGALAALVLGFAAIQAAAAWTADAAPLTVAPVSASSIEGRLAEEQARSAELQAELSAVRDDTATLASALEAARARIDAGATHAAELERDLATAKRKLATLQKSIKQAARAVTISTRTITTDALPPHRSPDPAVKPSDDGDD